ncbi:ABC transporter ATP-binding protein [Amycolatopsis keratiniphila]|uniref:Multidrug ABC transporter ATP-binding protein n=1 Tax=Amycolatopsis keratiniphila subsp. keratiniphila TaxID=227715 RepID=A0A1W2LP72_9PSEU|nr:ABC transporter ATP-binding protein [Amycolatopsis keratiniphila]ONF64717.1 multidrug ABC transporter ATP-binding protein [Amycolatopsis keratiniphila subsp. keratiniphila]
MITLRGLTKRYGEKTVVDGLTFAVEPGKVTGFLGPNGAGKSTTMRMTLGLDAPSAGEVRIDGKRYEELRFPLREVGALLEAKALHPGRSAAKHLLAMARSNGIPASRVDEVLATVGLTDVAGKRAGTFSLGMGQRLGIAGALLGDPGVLMFDEPVNGLDPDGVRWVRHLMRSLAEEGRTVFVSSHLMSEMQLTADRLVVIGKGRLLADAPVDEFITGNSRTSVVVRVPAPADLRVLDQRLRALGAITEADQDELLVHDLPVHLVGDAVHELGIRVHGLTERTASLEQAYMELTASSVEYGTGVAA